MGLARCTRPLSRRRAWWFNSGAMGILRLLCLAPILAAAIAGPARAAEPPRLLYFTLSAAFRHDVIPLSRQIVAELGGRSGAFEVTASEDVAVFSTDNLARYGAVMFFTSGELPMNNSQKAAFLAFVRSGHGFVGVHSATDTFYQWRDYLELIGGYFNDHPWHQKVTIAVADPTDPIARFLAPAFAIDDEIYQISDFDDRGSHVLLRLDPRSVDLNKRNLHPRFYGWPLAWTRAYGRGRVFYSALGHEPAVWRDPRYQQLLLNGILWSLGKGN
jgi:uncharacterized protein